MIQFERIQNAGHRYFANLLALYRASFPAEERRDADQLTRMLPETRMFFTAVIAGNEPAGLVIYWKFEGFMYVEHLAIFPHLRRKGIGEKVLKKLQNMGDPVLLEVDAPFDPVGFGRVTFYNKCGFHALPVDYIQPPYREGETPLPMMLFSDKTDWEPGILAGFTELFQWEVYYSRHKDKG